MRLVVTTLVLVDVLVSAAACMNLPDGAVCAATSACAEGLECVLVADPSGEAEATGERRCKVPGDVLDCCLAGDDVDDGCEGSLIDVTTLGADEDGCRDGLICLRAVNTGIDGGPQDPVCAQPADRGLGERCNVNADECADGLVCTFGRGTCLEQACVSDDDCAGTDVCVRGSELCPASCAPPTQLGDVCFVEGDEQCGLIHPCAEGLTCAPFASGPDANTCVST